MGTVACRGGRKRQTQRKGPRRSPWLCTDTVNGSILARPCFLNAPRGVCCGLLAGGAEWLGLRAAIQVMPARESARGSLLSEEVCLSVSEEPRAPAEGLAFPASRKDICFSQANSDSLDVDLASQVLGRADTGCRRAQCPSCGVRMPGP